MVEELKWQQGALSPWEGKVVSMWDLLGILPSGALRWFCVVEWEVRALFACSILSVFSLADFRPVFLRGMWCQHPGDDAGPVSPFVTSQLGREQTGTSAAAE